MLNTNMQNTNVAIMSQRVSGFNEKNEIIELKYVFILMVRIEKIIKINFSVNSFLIALLIYMKILVNACL
jgi:hypothetical protein